MALRAYTQSDLSGAMQVGTSHLLRKRNEVASATNANFNKKIGSAARRDGYEKVARTIESSNDSLYGGIFNYYDNNKVITGINNTANTASGLRYMDTADYWTNIFTDGTASTRYNCLNYLDELYVAGKTTNGIYEPLRNVDYTLAASTTRNVLNAPQAAFIAEFQDSLLAINCQINGVNYKDRAYVSSNSVSVTFLTRVQTDQKGLLKQLRVDSVQYIKPGMVLDIYGGSSNAKKITALTVISVDKKNNRFSFADTAIDVADNDELYITGRKGMTNIYWNVDYPNEQDAPYIQAPSDRETNPEFTAYGKNNGRFYLFTKNQFLKFDGANLITVSDTIGCVSHETVKNIGSWTIWLHTSGVYGYNDNTGEIKLLSRAVQPYIDAINQTNLAKTSAGVAGRVYKLSLGELLPLESATTSTSTSSTSTSSTSTSTSSTSTSSTSTSSTSLSTSSTSRSTSTSSTSVSTSSTSASTTSVSTSSTSLSVSTSTSSTTTTTLRSTKKVIRLCYDFDMNSWWTEEHKREFRFQFNHTMHGYTKPYFTDETGRLFRDETGNLDNADTIPFAVELGRNNFGTDQKKTYHSLLVDSENARGLKLLYSIDGNQFQSFSETITNNVHLFVFPQGGQLLEGRDINYKFAGNFEGAAPIINGLTSYFAITENIPNESSRL